MILWYTAVDRRAPPGWIEGRSSSSLTIDVRVQTTAPEVAAAPWSDVPPLPGWRRHAGRERGLRVGGACFPEPPDGEEGAGERGEREGEEEE